MLACVYDLLAILLLPSPVSQAFAPLHHVAILTQERTLALLREGTHSPVSGAIPAAEIARRHPSSAAAALIIRAAEPWSPSTNEIWGAAHRSRAVELLKIGYLVARTYASGEGEGSVIDVWVAHVMSRAITWDYKAASEPVSPSSVSADRECRSTRPTLGMPILFANSQSA